MPKIVVAAMLVTLVLLMGCSEGTSQAVRGDKGPVLILRVSRGNVSSCGSASIVSYNGRKYVLTAWHTLDKGGEISLYDGEDRLQLELGAVTALKELDVAVLPIAAGGEQLAAYELDFSAPAQGTRCQVLGYTSDHEYVVRQGEVTEVIASTSCQVEHGLSGGPLISDGKVVGVTTSILIKTDKVGLVTNGGNHTLAGSFEKLFR